MGKLALAGERVCKNRKRFFAVTKGGRDGRREERQAGGLRYGETRSGGQEGCGFLGEGWGWGLD